MHLQRDHVTSVEAVLREVVGRMLGEPGPLRGRDAGMAGLWHEGAVG